MDIRKGNRRNYKILLTTLILLILSSYSVSFAQIFNLGSISSDRNTVGLRSQNSENINPISFRSDSLSVQRDIEKMSGEEIVQEGSIEIDKYIVGPGDKFRLKIWGEYDYEDILTLSPTGRLVLPEFGPVKLDSLTFSDAQNTVLERLSRLYKKENTNISFDLVSIRKFRAHILGEVVSPGLYVITPVNRLTDLIALSGGVKFNGDISRIKLLRDSDTTVVNLYDYYLKADLDANPLLDERTLIFVPQLNLSDEKVFLLSGLTKGYLRIIDNETISSLLFRTGAITRTQELESILVKRNSENIYLNDPFELYNYQLNDMDTIIISTYTDSVYVIGEIEKPGAVKYISGLSLKEYISLAGGPTGSGSYKRIDIIRDGDEIRNDSDIMAGDIIKVKKNGIALIREYTTVISPIASIVLTAYAIGLWGND